MDIKGLVISLRLESPGGNGEGQKGTKSKKEQKGGQEQNGGQPLIEEGKKITVMVSYANC